MDSEPGAMSTEDYVHDLTSIDLDLDDVALEHLKQQENKFASHHQHHGANGGQQMSANVEQQMRLVHNAMAPQHNLRGQKMTLIPNAPASPPDTPPGNNNSLPPSPAFAVVPNSINMTSPLGNSVDLCHKGGMLDESSGMSMSWLTSQLKYGSQGNALVNQDGPLDLRGQAEIDNAWLSGNMRRDYIEISNMNHNVPNGMITRQMANMVNGNGAANGCVPNGLHPSQHHHHQPQHPSQMHNGHSQQHSHNTSHNGNNLVSSHHHNGHGANGHSNYPTAREIRDMLDDESLIHLTVRELNKRLHGFPREEVVRMKQKRRTLKNRGYAQNCRTKRMAQRHDLEQKNRFLQNEMTRLRLDYDQVCQERDQICQERDFYRDQLGLRPSDESQTRVGQQMQRSVNKQLSLDD